MSPQILETQCAEICWANYPRHEVPWDSDVYWSNYPNCEAVVGNDILQK